MPAGTALAVPPSSVMATPEEDCSRTASCWLATKPKAVQRMTPMRVGIAAAEEAEAARASGVAWALAAGD